MTYQMAELGQLGPVRLVVVLKVQGSAKLFVEVRAGYQFRQCGVEADLQR